MNETAEPVPASRIARLGVTRQCTGRLFTFLLACLTSFAAAAEDPTLGGLFTRRGIEGTMVISGLRSGRTYIHNYARANHRFPPASTFKMPNTLIALEEGAISGKDDTFKWDGQVYGVADWNHDQTLQSAFRVSCVWCYQALARRVGAERYKDHLDQTGYGELHEPFAVESFWLDGALGISAMEQVEFLKKVFERSLPFSPSAYETLRQIMVVEETPAYTVRAKTGWATREIPQVGWYVGYVETPDDVWFFALNMVTRGEEDLPLRQQLMREAFQALGILG